VETVNEKEENVCVPDCLMLLLLLLLLLSIVVAVVAVVVNCCCCCCAHIYVCFDLPLDGYMPDYIWHCWQIIYAEYLFQARNEAKCLLLLL